MTLHRHTDDCYGEIDGRLMCGYGVVDAYEYGGTFYSHRLTPEVQPHARRVGCLLIHWVLLAIVLGIALAAFAVAAPRSALSPAIPVADSGRTGASLPAQPSARDPQGYGVRAAVRPGVPVLSANSGAPPAVLSDG